MKKNVNFQSVSIDSAKVANVEYRYYQYGTAGYLLNNGNLIAVIVASVLVDLKNQKITSVLKDATGDLYTREGEYDLYADTAAFNAGDRKKRVKASTEFFLQHAHNNLHCCTSYLCDVDDEKKTSNSYLTVWVMENGNPTEVPVVINSVIRNEDENGQWHLCDGNLPDLFWESRKHALDNNEYTLIDEDGDTFAERGTQLRLTPTKEQFEALKKLNEAFKTAKETGLAFAWDRDNCGNLMAFNATEMTQCGWDIVPSGGYGTIIPMASVAYAKVDISFVDYCGCDDDMKLELKPTPRQMKQWKKEHPDAQ